MKEGANVLYYESRHSLFPTDTLMFLPSLDTKSVFIDYYLLFYYYFCLCHVSFVSFYHLLSFSLHHFVIVHFYHLSKK
jgi:hypothetical protein